MVLGGIAVSDAFNDAGTFGAFGFLGAYVFVSIAAPMYLRKIGELRPRDIAYSVIALAFLLVPAIGSVYPVPAPPVNACRGRGAACAVPPHGSGLAAFPGEWREGISPSRSLRTVREPLDSYGSHHPVVF
jgi:hypothetical protein